MSDITEALQRELAGYELRGQDDRAAEVKVQLKLAQKTDADEAQAEADALVEQANELIADAEAKTGRSLRKAAAHKKAEAKPETEAKPEADAAPAGEAPAGA
jgi:hypothetical protein